MALRITIISALLIISSALRAQSFRNAIGLRLGSPMGVSYKQYLSERSAWEVTFGTVPRSWYWSYYRNSFNDNDDYDGFRYSSHDVESTVFLGGRYLLRQPLAVSDSPGRLTWYYGGGAMLKLARVQYRYTNLAAPQNGALSDDNVDIDFGPEAITGLEYLIEDIPLSAFAEASAFFEITDRPGAFRLFGGVGVRYHF